MIRLILVSGGNSVEHEISLLTLKQVDKAINKDKYDVKSVYLSKDNKFYLIKNKNNKTLNDYKKYPLELIKENNKQYFKYKRKKIYFDYLFLLVHGKGVEDGTLHSYLDFLDIPYISNNVVSSNIGMDKYLTKELVKDKVKTLDHILVNLNDFNYEELIDKLDNYPYIFKANSLGSSIGVIKVNNEYEVMDAINTIKVYDDYLLIEKCLDNFKEYNLSLFKEDFEFITSSIEEINYKKVLSYNDKYKNSLENLNREINPKISDELKELIINNSKYIYNKLKCDFLVRIDYLYNEDENTLYFNEINMIPGSLAFYLYEDKGILFDELLDKLINVGKRNRYLKINKVNVLGDYVLESLVGNIKK